MSITNLLVVGAHNVTKAVMVNQMVGFENSGNELPIPAIPMTVPLYFIHSGGWESDFKVLCEGETKYKSIWDSVKIFFGKSFYFINNDDIINTLRQMQNGIMNIKKLCPNAIGIQLLYNWSTGPGLSIHYSVNEETEIALIGNEKQVMAVSGSDFKAIFSKHVLPYVQYLFVVHSDRVECDIAAVAESTFLDSTNCYESDNWYNRRTLFSPLRFTQQCIIPSNLNFEEKQSKLFVDLRKFLATHSPINATQDLAPEPRFAKLFKDLTDLASDALQVEHGDRFRTILMPDSSLPYGRIKYELRPNELTFVMHADLQNILISHSSSIPFLVFITDPSQICAFQRDYDYRGFFFVTPGCMEALLQLSQDDSRKIIVELHSNELPESEQFNIGKRLMEVLEFDFSFHISANPFKVYQWRIFNAEVELNKLMHHVNRFVDLIRQELVQSLSLLFVESGRIIQAYFLTYYNQSNSIFNPKYFPYDEDGYPGPLNCNFELADVGTEFLELEQLISRTRYIGSPLSERDLRKLIKFMAGIQFDNKNFIKIQSDFFKIVNAYFYTFSSMNFTRGHMPAFPDLHSVDYSSPSAGIVLNHVSSQHYLEYAESTSTSAKRIKVNVSDSNNLIPTLGEFSIQCFSFIVD